MSRTPVLFGWSEEEEESKAMETETKERKEEVEVKVKIEALTLKEEEKDIFLFPGYVSFPPSTFLVVKEPSEAPLYFSNFNDGHQSDEDENDDFLEETDIGGGGGSGSGSKVYFVINGTTKKYYSFQDIFELGVVRPYSFGFDQGQDVQKRLPFFSIHRSTILLIMSKLNTSVDFFVFEKM